MSACRSLIRPVCLEMSVVSTRSLALWPPMSPFLRSSSFWICPGVFCAVDTAGTTSNKHTAAAQTARNCIRARG